MHQKKQHFIGSVRSGGSITKDGYGNNVAERLCDMMRHEHTNFFWWPYWPNGSYASHLKETIIQQGPVQKEFNHYTEPMLRSLRNFYRTNIIDIWNLD